MISAPLLGFSYTLQIPGGDLEKRFGYNSNIGGSFLYKTKKNYLFGIEGGFLFGNIVKDTLILDGVKTKDKLLINADGNLVGTLFYERGYTISAKAGKLFPFKKPNRNSGIILLSGVGFLQHKIRIEAFNHTIPQVSQEYKKGYDRLTNGLALSQFAGYQYLSNRRLINFFAGFEFMEAFTKNRRGYNYDTMQYDNKLHTDLLYGFRFGWILPLYPKKPKEFYFY